MTGFVCQSYLKEQRRPPTGGLSEAGGVIGGGRVFMPLSPGVGRKDLGASATRFPLPGENDGYCLGWNDPHWCGSGRSL